MAKRWRGVLLREGVETEEYVHRLIDPGAARWRSLPRDFGCVFEDGSYGHENAVVVGTIDLIERRGADIYAEGPVLLGSEDADRWVAMNEQGALRGVSIDITGGQCVVEIVNSETGEVVPEEIGIEIMWGEGGGDYYVRERWTDAEIGSTVACRVPAFPDALVEVYDTVEAPAAAPAEQAPPAPAAPAASSTNGSMVATAATFAAIGDVAVDDRVMWTDVDGTEQQGTITAVDTAAEEVTVATDVPEGAPPGTAPVEVTLPVADVTVIDENGQPVAAEAEAEPFPELARRAASVRPVNPGLAAMLARSRGEAVTASLVAQPGAVVTAAVSWGDGAPPEAFARRQLDRPTGFTIEDNGYCYGHLRLNGQCHMGFSGGLFSRCVTVPDSPTQYALFHASRRYRCADGTRVPVGVLAMDTTHAPAGRPGRRPSLAATQRWYEDTGLQGAYLHAYDDEWGTQVCGILRSGLSVEDARRAMCSTPSGDWRDYGQGLDLTGIVLVNVPGYPIYEMEDGEASLVLASLAPSEAVLEALAGHEGAGAHGCGCDAAAGACTCTAAIVAPVGMAASRALRLAAVRSTFKAPTPAGV